MTYQEVTKSPELGVSSLSRPVASSSTDRRAIPAHAREGVWHAPDGHAVRRIDWHRDAGEPGRGSLLFVPGRGDCYEKYLEVLEGWHEAGWSVTSLDWRGQALSGRLGLDATTGHVSDFAGWVEDLAAFAREWRDQAAGPHVCVAHSMGGHIVLRAVAERKVSFRALVLTAPMLGMLPDRFPSRHLHALARIISRLGDPRRPAWKSNETPVALASRIELLTHDEARYADEAWWRETRPELAMGPASWGWIVAALASIRRLEAPGVLEGVTLPVLIIATQADRLVSWRAIARAAARLPHAELVAFGSEARHEILREVDPVRTRALDAIAEFLDRVAPATSS